MNERWQSHITHALATTHLDSWPRVPPDWPTITGYCIDAPELLPAGSTLTMGRGQSTLRAMSRRHMAGEET